MQFGLTENIIESIQKVFEDNSKVDEVIVFGSRAKGNYGPGSDIDLAIKGRNISFDDILTLSEKLDELDIPYKIDLIDYNAITEKDLTEHIDRVGIIFYERWRKSKIKDIADVTMGQSPQGETCNQNGDGLPLLNGPTEFTDKFPKPVQFTTSPQRVSQKGDILFCVRGSTTGRMNYSDGVYAIGRGIAAIRHKGGPGLQPFLKGLIDYSLPELLAATSGSVFPNITGNDILNYEILLPPLQEQVTIASILSSLDDKIDLLHRQNKIFEQLAETIFRQWFVEEAEENWETATILNIADHLKESVNPSKQPAVFFHHYSLPAFDEGRTPKIEIGKEILSNKYKVVSNSILVSKLNPRFPRIWPLYGHVADNSICSTEFQVVKPKDNAWFGFIYCFLNSNQVTQQLANASGGTSGSHQRVNPDDIFNLSFSLPPDGLIEKFDTITKSSWIKIKLNYNQIKTLTQIRDNLLPKLMSGEVRVQLN